MRIASVRTTKSHRVGPSADVARKSLLVALRLVSMHRYLNSGVKGTILFFYICNSYYIQLYIQLSDIKHMNTYDVY